MEAMIHAVLHLDQSLGMFMHAYGAWTYVVLFVIVFCETGLVVMPFLPGDSLLFAAGTFAGLGSLEIVPLLFVLSAAAILGDSLNYALGACIGPRVFRNTKNRFLHPKHLERTRAFYERHGTKTIILARFLPVLRTFAPFVAGIGRMHYGRFLAYNIIGGCVWVFMFVIGGSLFGAIPAVQKNFTVVILGIVAISCLPILAEAVRTMLQKYKERWRGVLLSGSHFPQKEEMEIRRMCRVIKGRIAHNLGFIATSPRLPA